MIYGHVDDLRIVGRDLGGRRGLTLVSVVRDELYFLPAFLDHYRRLGVARFVMLDDRSGDGTRDYLADQPDVMVLESPGHRFGDPVFPGRSLPPFAGMRVVNAWRSLMLGRYCAGDWALAVDVDEFIALPAGIDLPGVAARAEAEGVRGVVAAMLDVYPADVAAMRRAAPFDAAAGWHFDAERHLRLRPGAPPEALYPGVRARLHSVHGLREPGWRRRLRQWRHGRAYNPVNMTAKLVLMRWQPSDFFVDSHWPDLPASDRLLLPLVHYKFSHDLWRRMEHALASGAYYRGSEDYRRLAVLLERMEASGAGFLDACSRPVDGFAGFAASGNACL